MLCQALRDRKEPKVAVQMLQPALAVFAENQHYYTDYRAKNESSRRYR
jgi:hypothetical protein